MSLNDLRKLVKPPAHPTRTPSHSNEWARIEAELGLALPSDYKEFITIYGGGLLGVLIHVLSPFTDVEGVSLVSRAGWESERLAGMHDDLEYDIWPDSPGLLTWGNDENSNVYFWYTKGEPDEWPILVDAPHCELEEFDMPMTTFLAKGLCGEIRSAHWPDEWPRETSLVFKPFE